MEDMRRVKRPKEQAKASYDRLSKGYDFLFGRMERRFRDEGLMKINIKKGENVLEVGFGTGYCTQNLAASVGDSGKVYGIDMSEGMLNITSKRLEKSGLIRRAELQIGDAMSLPYAPNFFDAIFISFTLELFDTPNIPIVLREFHRVLKDKGRICVVAMSKEGKAGAMLKLYEWSHERFPNYIDCRPIYLRQVLEDASFKIAEFDTMSLLNVPVGIALAVK